MNTEETDGKEGHKQKREKEKKGSRLPEFSNTVC